MSEGGTPVPEGVAARPRRKRRRAGLAAEGEALQWLTGGALVIALAMVAGLAVLIIVEGTRTFWPGRVERLGLHDGRVVLGEFSRDEDFELSGEAYAALPEAVRNAPGAPFDGRVPAEVDPDQLRSAHRRLLRTGNFEITEGHYTWVSDFEVARTEYPPWALVIERLKNGRFYGEPLELLELAAVAWDEEALAQQRIDAPQARVLATADRGRTQRVSTLAELHEDDVVVARILDSTAGAEASWKRFQELHPLALELNAERRTLEKVEVGRLNAAQESARLAVVEARLKHGAGSAEESAEDARYKRLISDQELRFREIELRIAAIEAEQARHALFVRTATGETKAIAPAEITIAYPPNQLSFWGRLQVWLTRAVEFLTEDPRAANTEGGVVPAIFGTVVMTLIMCLAVVPFGVLAALYLREYAKRGPIVTAVRIAVNNLAGVPSIVYGVFGLGFFCYGFGKFVDGGPQRGLGLTPWSEWSWILALLALLALIGAALILGAQSTSARLRSTSPWPRWMTRASHVCWTSAALLSVGLILYTPFFDGFFVARLEEGQPTFGTSGLLWASLTLALLTLPVVIVSTEEALAAVPSSMREGSYACGASKWQTIRRIVLPRALPGILTGTILSMARGAGEVAPLMLVGVVKLSQKLAVDSVFPYVHPERSFMHLGFNIYDVGFQSQNAEAGKPIVFTTTLLLVLIIATLNLFAVWLRSRLRRRFVDGAF